MLNLLATYLFLTADLPLLFSTEIIKKLFILWTNLNLILCNFREPSHRA